VISELQAAEFCVVPLLPSLNAAIGGDVMFDRSSARRIARFAVLSIALFSSGQRLAFAQAAAPVANPAPQAPPATTPQQPAGLWSEPGFLSSAIKLANQFSDHDNSDKSGFYPELSNMITGSGWLAVGPGYRRYFGKDDLAMFDASAAVSWHLYKMGQAHLERQQLAGGHLTIGTQVMWQDNTQVNYFGIGPDVQDDDRSQYQMQSTDYVGYATVTTKEWLSINGELGWLGRPKLMNPAGTFKPDVPSTLDAFPTDPAANLSVQPRFLHSEASIIADTRNHRGYPTQGSMYRGALTNYWDKSDGVFTFHTWEAEGLKYVPLSDARVVLAFHGWTVYSNPSEEIPFYLLPAMGGNRTNRAFHNFEFHDNSLLVLQAESRFAVWEHLDAALFVDAGNVAQHYGDLDLGQRSYGAGLRVHTEKTTLARLDVADGHQGWHVVFSTSEPFRLPRVRRIPAIIPFFP
jgi:Omp85 superfamily domain